MVKKSEFIWNTIASIVTALLSAVLLMICTRINGTEVAGMFSIVYATSIILNRNWRFWNKNISSK